MGTAVAAIALRHDRAGNPGEFTMANAMKIREHMRVLGSDGEPVGTVDHLEGDKIKLTRTDSMADGQHHWLPTSWVEDVDEDEDEVMLGMPAADVMRQWDAQNQSDARP